MKELDTFLKLNGFKKKGNTYKNNKCALTVEKGYYRIEHDNPEDPSGTIISYSKDLSIYRLIGFLTYYKLMTKNYRQV